MFVGYQAEGTLGRIIYEGAKKVKLFGEEVEVKAEICYLAGVSGHADKNGLLEWLGGFEKKPKRVFVNHGDDDSCTDFAKTLSELGYESFAPFSGTVYNLFADELEVVTEGVPAAEMLSASQRTHTLFEALVSAAEDVLSFVKACKGRPNREISAMTDQLRAFLKKNK